MVKLVDALDSKSSGPCARESSNLSSGITDHAGLAVLASPFFLGSDSDCTRKRKSPFEEGVFHPACFSCVPIRSDFNRDAASMVFASIILPSLTMANNLSCE